MKLKSIKTLAVLALAVPAVAIAISLFNPLQAFAATCIPGVYTIVNGAACAQPAGTSGTLFGEGGVFTSIVNTALFVIGAVAVLMLIYGGVRYTISGGDEKSITSAKNTILYAIIGIIISVLAYAIINFVLTSLTPTV